MPALSADWEAVKATAIALGSIKEAAEAHGVSYGAARVQATREEWPVGRRVHEQARAVQQQAREQVVRSSKGAVTSVTSAAEALQKAHKERGLRTKTALIGAAMKASEYYAELEPELIAADAQNLKAVTSVADTLHGWTAKTQQGGAQVLVNVNLLRMLGGEVTAEVTPTYDLEQEQPLSPADMAETGQDESDS